jgi:hypothetical protein
MWMDGVPFIEDEQHHCAKQTSDDEYNGQPFDKCADSGVPGAVTALLHSPRMGLHSNDYQAVQYLLLTLQIRFIRKIFVPILR